VPDNRGVRAGSLGRSGVDQARRPQLAGRERMNPFRAGGLSIVEEARMTTVNVTGNSFDGSPKHATIALDRTVNHEVA
jgi:hypothetical protein